MMRNRTITLTLLGVLGMARVTSAQPCPGDLNGDNEVTIDEVIVAINSALNGCTAAAATPTPSQSPTVTLRPTTTRTPSVTWTATATRSATIGNSPTPTPRFRDNGNGTITDTSNGLVWQKQGDDGGLLDKDMRYSWTLSGSTAPIGTVFSTLLQALNASRFGGYNDWRLPTLEELQTLVSRGAGSPGAPLVLPEFNKNCLPGCSVTQCSCTMALNYWTVTPNASYDQQAWYVLFNTGNSGVGFKTLEFHARAVRGGR